MGASLSCRSFTGVVSVDESSANSFQASVEDLGMHAQVSVSFVDALIARADGLLRSLDSPFIPLSRLFVALIDIVELAADLVLELFSGVGWFVVHESLQDIFLAAFQRGGGCPGR